jgi:hypothetical protein
MNWKTVIGIVQTHNAVVFYNQMTRRWMAWDAEAILIGRGATVTQALSEGRGP